MFTIGQFSRLCQVSARMLRHYDRRGLLHPARTGSENGYRYYETDQLARVHKIETLKGYGFSLTEIGVLLELGPQELAVAVQRRRVTAYRELGELRRALRRMEEDMSKMEGINLSRYHVILMETPSRRVLGLRRTIAIGEVHELFSELYREMERRGLRRSGATQLVCLGEEFSYEQADVEAQVEVAGEHPDVKTLPASLCAAVTHTGPYETIRYAYEAIGAWLSSHPDYEVCGPAIERYLRDENEVGDPEELQTGVLFPVKKREG